MGLPPPLRGEAQLLLSTISPAIPKNVEPQNFIEHALLRYILQGDFLSVLKSPQAVRLFTLHEPETGPEYFFRAVKSNAIKAWAAAGATEVGAETSADSPSPSTWVPSAAEFESRAEDILHVGVACLYVFMQANMTGSMGVDTISSFSSSLTHFCATLEPSAGAAIEDSVESSALIQQRLLLEKKKKKKQQEEEEEWAGWSRKELMKLADGSDTVGKIVLPQYLLLARLLLLSDAAHLAASTASPWSQPWWACRVVAMHQRILSDKSPTLRSLLLGLSRLTLLRFGDPARLAGSQWEAGDRRVGPILAAEAHVEAGLVEHAYGHVEAARLCFQRASDICGFSWQLTGAMGYRTKHQVDAKAQLVLHFTSHLGSDYLSDREEEEEGAAMVESREREEGNDGDVFLNPRLVQAEEQQEGAAMAVLPLSSIEQAILLGFALHVRKSNPDDELRSWQIAPFIEAVDSQAHVRAALRASCDLLRIRWERERPRTRQRAILSMETLVNRMTAASMDTGYAFAAWLPTWPALQKEYGELLVSNGCVGEALHIFESLELWDSLIDLHRMLGKVQVATDLVRERLKVQPQDPRLWCSLGDLTFDESAYVTAWQVSGGRFARAQRALARLAFNRGAYADSVLHWKAGLAINPLHPDGWFSLGYAAIKAKEDDTALRALTRSVQLEPDNGEAWNNIAVLHLKRNSSSRAFSALTEALKYKRDSWQMWANYVHVALDERKLNQAVRGLKTVMDLTSNKQVDVPAIGRLVDEVEVGRGIRPAPSLDSDSLDDPPEDNEDDAIFAFLQPLNLPSLEAAAEDSAAAQSEHSLPADDSCTPDEAARQSRHQDWLEGEVRSLIGRVSASGLGAPGIWDQQARFFKAVGDAAMEHEALLKLVRSLQGSGWHRSRDRFVEFQGASLRLVESYLHIAKQEISRGSQKGAERQLSSVRMHLRNLLKQAELFKDTPEYKCLELRLEEVQCLSSNFVGMDVEIGKPI